jgi:2-keto-4-pentenoate hydratase/2-oxohepta-3-ene-1,7-dioic acid hydratase in catechol pathway
MIVVFLFWGTAMNDVTQIVSRIESGDPRATTANWRPPMIRCFVYICLTFVITSRWATAADPKHYLRFQKGETVAYGLLEGERVRELAGDLFGTWSKTEIVHALSDVKVLPPTQPSQVLALAGNYRSHVAGAPNSAIFNIPQPFFKSPSCLIGHEAAIVIPKDARDVHYEAELVIVIGKKCRKVPPNEALDYVFGVTAGNDVSERVWQNDEDQKDVQWWRAKGSDTFGPVGPYIVTGVDYGNLKLQLRLNGELKQQANTDQLIHDVPTVVSFISQYITLQPGDLIFTGTPGSTSAIKPSDVVEVELEGAGMLRNRVVAEK